MLKLVTFPSLPQGRYLLSRRDGEISQGRLWLQPTNRATLEVGSRYKRHASFELCVGVLLWARGLQVKEEHKGDQSCRRVQLGPEAFLDLKDRKRDREDYKSETD